MTDYLVYWKYYWRDIEARGPFIVIPEWHTYNENFYDRLNPGDNLWVVIQAGADHPNEWSLLQKIYIERLEIDRDEDKYDVEEYGLFHVIGNPNRSQVFRLARQRDFTPVLRRLEFASGRRITSKGKLIGRSLQTARPMPPGI